MRYDMGVFLPVIGFKKKTKTKTKNKQKKKQKQKQKQNRTATQLCAKLQSCTKLLGHFVIKTLFPAPQNQCCQR